MEGSIVPGQTMASRQVLEPGDEVLGERGAPRPDTRDRRNRRGSPGAGPRGPCNGRGDPARGRSRRRRAAGPARGPRSGGSPASGAERNRVWPYSRNRQQRPLIWQTGAQPGHLGIERGVELPQLVEIRRPELGDGRRGGFVVSVHFWTIARECLDLGRAYEHRPWPGAGADLADVLPVLPPGEVLGPERPGAALIGPRG